MDLSDIGLGIFGIVLAIVGIVQVWRPRDVIAFRKRFPVANKLDLTFFVWDSQFAVPIVRGLGVVLVLLAVLVLGSYAARH